MFGVSNQMGVTVEVWLDDYQQRSSNRPKTASNFSNTSAKIWVDLHTSKRM
jgi:hypothetical protein